MKKCLLSALILALCVGCTVMKPFTSGLEKSAMLTRQSQGWIESKVTPGLYGAPQKENPEWLAVAMTPAQIAAEVYPVKYPILRGLEVSLDGLGVAGTGYVAYKGIEAVVDDGGGDNNSSGSTTDNRTTSTSTSSSDRHDTPINVDAGDNSPVTINYQSGNAPP